MGVMENNILHGVYLQELLGRNHGKKRNISFHGVSLQVSPGGNRGKKRNYISPWCLSAGISREKPWKKGEISISKVSLCRYF